MAKNQSGTRTPKEPGVILEEKPRIDVVRLATLGGIVALVVISFLIWRSIDSIQTILDSRLVQIDNRVAQLSNRMNSAVAQNQPQQRGPDPSRVYAINTAGAPFKGPAGAPITIAEFSDFQ